MLAHQVDTDQTDWLEFAGELASNGFTVLTFNFQGTCGGGCSGGGVPTAELWTDIVAAVAFLEECGAGRIGLVGASLGGEASIAAAAHLGPRISAVITLSASLGLAETGLGEARRDAAAIVAPTLFVAGESDAGADPPDRSGGSRESRSAWRSSPSASTVWSCCGGSRASTFDRSCWGSSTERFGSTWPVVLESLRQAVEGS